ncbi:MAG: class I SAM-dependent methyltransferase [Candidatus Hodarchaeota archaeon]
MSNKSYNEFKAEGLKQITNDSRTKNSITALEKYLAKEDIILDLGCGYGRLTIPLKDQGYHICGVDLSEILIEEAKREAKKVDQAIEFKVGSMLNIPYSDEKFDKIICMWLTFNHLLTKHNQIQALNEIYRVLKAGGAAVIEMINGESDSIKRELKESGIGEDKRIRIENINGVEFHFFIHDKKTFRRICELSSFQEFYIKSGDFGFESRLVGLLYKD